MARVFRFLFGLALALAPAAWAQAPAAPKAMLGSWVLAQDGEGGSTCTLTLQAPLIIGGFRLTSQPRCKRVLEAADDFYAWYLNPKGDLVLADATRHAVLAFSMADGTWIASPEPGTQLLLSRPTKPRSAQEQMTGRWNIAAVGGVPLCQLSFSSDAAGRTGTISRGGACATAWLDRGWTSWRRDGDALQILDRRGRVAFSLRRVDLVTFEATIAGNQTVFLTRP